MKKFLKTGKKALSVFMAVMMVLTAWVFFEPMEASAINGGRYTYKVLFEVTDSMDNCYMNYYLYGKGDNGTSTTETLIRSGYWSDMDVRTTSYAVLEGMTEPGVFPERIEITDRNGEAYNVNRSLKMNIYLYINNTSMFLAANRISSGNGSYSIGSGTPATFSWDTAGGGTSNTFDYEFKIDSFNYPKALSIVWNDSLSDFTIAGSTSAASYCKDQYGVKLATTPTASFTSSSMTGLTQEDTDSTTSYSTKITADDTARMSGQGTNSRTVEITHSYALGGTTISGSKTFTITDPQYNVTLNANGGTLSTDSPIAVYYGDQYGVTPGATRTGCTLIGFYPTEQGLFLNENTPTGTALASDTVITSDVTYHAAWRANKYTATFNYKDANYADASTSKTQYYSTDLTAPDIPTTIDIGVDYTYTFKEWSPTLPSTMPAADNTYTATYDMTTHYADYTEVVEQIGAAQAKIAETFYQEGGYTPTSVSAFEAAYDQAVASNNNKLLLSQQEQVDALAEALKTARENLTLKKYTVLFVDEDGAIIKDGYFYVDHGTKVTAPTVPEKEPDADYHYTFTGWDSTDSDSMSELNSVTHNLKYVAKFTKTAHTFTETTESGCHGGTITTKTCSDCGYSETTASDVTLHTWSDDYQTISPATCSTVGKEAKYCTQCGAYDASSVRDIATTTHSYGAWIVEEAATCGREGVQYRTCSNCGQAEIEKINATGNHTYTTKFESAATCTADGVKIEVCSGCGDTKITSTTKLGHNLSTTTTREATCVSVGVKETKCSRCDYCTTEIVSATDTHSYGDWTTVSTATCISKGIKTRECSVCGKVETEITDETEHDWGEWTEVTPATCTAKGTEKRVCANDASHVETREIDMIAHTEVIDVAVDATCETAGKTAGSHCSVCGEVLVAQTEISALGHNWGAWVQTKAPTCMEKGTETRTCDRCGGTETRDIAKSGHHIVTIPGFAATCEEAGKTDGAYCSVCGTVTKEQTEIPAKGHIDTNGDGKCDECDVDYEGHCSCICHNNNIFSKIVRWFCTLLTKIFRTRIACCEDMEYWGGEISDIS